MPELVAEGRGVGIVDPVASKPFTEGLAIRPFNPKIRYQIAILSPRRMKRRPGWRRISPNCCGASCGRELRARGRRQRFLSSDLRVH
ncbi:hypothetical protein [Bradyrhizobium septentrionale]|uniref:LysR substrate-binding domain-containing protein n=1 Tax=Bradyrhizobium septentrionale TaxID=1404411 RepID=A0A974A338_9BRAD|nr:hypothetical protein [Bradyrhizobium septentrionale]UGY15542.1 hypothetical protein HAP48_0044685 [Bradyrhizobium septentrionale]UGY24126.1 hypothetical protein HU675_0040370 [Bradyrhizobium septentrionale]